MKCAAGNLTLPPRSTGLYRPDARRPDLAVIGTFAGAPPHKRRPLATVHADVFTEVLPQPDRSAAYPTLPGRPGSGRSSPVKWSYGNRKGR